MCVRERAHSHRHGMAGKSDSDDKSDDGPKTASPASPAQQLDTDFSPGVCCVCVCVCARARTGFACAQVHKSVV